ncbi:hypothetical protein AC231_18835 [Clostridium pasteurianum]|nr:hypothetical protein AC231_18835 [Clostridium pasteurianum]
MESNASSAVKKTGEFIEISKLNLDISCEEKKIDVLYAKIGKKIYAQYMKDRFVNNNFIKYCKEIDEIKYKISSIEKKILKVQNKKICPLCGNELTKNAVYCEHCGFKQKTRKKS